VAVLLCLVSLLCPVARATADEAVRPRNPNSIAYSRDGSLLAIGYSGASNGRFPLTANSDPKRGGGIFLHNATTGEQIRAIATYGDLPHLEFSPDGKKLISLRLYTPGDSVNGNAVTIWEVSTAKSLHVFSRSDAFALSPDGKRIVVSDYSRVALHDLETLEVIRQFESFDTNWINSCLSLKFSPDGTRLAGITRVGRTEFAIRVCDVESGELLLSSPEMALSYSFDWASHGDRIATGHDGGIVKLWDAKTLELVHELSTDSQGQQAVFFSPDGKTLAGASQSKPCITLWDASTGKPLMRKQYKGDASFRTVYARFRGTLVRPEYGPQRFAFEPDASHIAAGYNSGVLLHMKTLTVTRNLSP
jgi:WD40 repeat protein